MNVNIKTAKSPSVNFRLKQFVLWMPSKNNRNVSTTTYFYSPVVLHKALMWDPHHQSDHM